jgi:hypothetical protein
LSFLGVTLERNVSARSGGGLLSVLTGCQN